ncbi:MAG: TenA family protein [Chloroflexi bacterium]|nr:TenA family protein [Chloroflexota bacterium]
MPFADELRAKYHDQWESMVTHPFVLEMGDGSLDIAKFRNYFRQDYVFCKDLVKLTSFAIARAAPDYEAGKILNGFLSNFLSAENDLFLNGFHDLGVTAEQYLETEANPVTQGFGDFMVRTALEGDFDDLIALFYVTEGTYLDWAERLLNSGTQPNNAVYQGWIDIHSPDVLGDVVAWFTERLNDAGERANATKRANLERIFRTTLRYEYQFWEACYHGRDWHDVGMASGVLATEYAAYEKMRAELEAKYTDEWVVVHGEELVGVYTEFNDAAREAGQRFGRGPYLIRQVAPTNWTEYARELWQRRYAND